MSSRATMVLVLPKEIEAGDVSLHLRKLADVPELRTAIEMSLYELAGFLDWAAHGVPDREVLEAAVVARDVESTGGHEFEYVLREIASGELVGEAGGSLSDDGLAVDIGYWVRSDRTGRGYATAAARALTTEVFASYPDVVRVEIRMDKGNTRSQLVPGRLGFRLVGEESFDSEPLRGQTGQGLVWAATRSEWFTG